MLLDPDLRPLLHLFWRECCYEKLLRPFDPNFPAYTKLELTGFLRVLTARAEDRLVGIASYLIFPTLHHGPKFVTAINDVFYIRKEFRRGYTAMRMLRAAFKMLQETTSAAVVYHTSPFYRPLDPLFKAAGMVTIEKTFRKLLR